MNLNLTFSQHLGVSLFLFDSFTLQCFFIGILMKRFKDKTLTIDSKFCVPPQGLNSSASDCKAIAMSYKDDSNIPAGKVS